MQYIAIKTDDLTHSGVKGMRWGHRSKNSFSEKSAIRKEARKEYIKTEKEARQKYESVSSTFRVKTGKEFVDTFSGIVGTVGIIYGLSATNTGKRYISKILDI